MTDITGSLPSPTYSFFSIVALGAATIATPTENAHPAASYEITQTSGTFSPWRVESNAQLPRGDFFTELSRIFGSLNQRQNDLEEDFSTALYDNLEQLYET